MISFEHTHLTGIIMTTAEAHVAEDAKGLTSSLFLNLDQERERGEERER